MFASASICSLSDGEASFVLAALGKARLLMVKNPKFLV
jgi:hypothetical protein